MADNTIGKVFPGSLLWAGPVREGRLSQVVQIPNRPAVTTSFTLVRDVEPRPMALVFEHNGAFSSFLNGAADVFGAVGSGGMRLSANFKISTSFEDALLSVGISAKFWGSRASSGLEFIQNERRSVGVMTLDQVFYSAAVDIPSVEGFVPERLLRADAQLAASLAASAARDGEMVYVRKVDYGRRILVSLTAESSSEELNRALDVAIRFISGSIDIDIDDRTREVWESVEGKLIIIGGSFPPGISGFFGGDLTSFVQTIQTIMTADFINDTQGALPVSFELAYVSDNAPMQVFETAEFAGKIPGRTWGTPDFSEVIKTSGALGDSVKINSDDEINTDDWTYVSIDSQILSLDPDGRTIKFALVWSAHEGESNRTLRGDRTVIESRKTFPFPQPGPVKVEGEGAFAPITIGPFGRWFSGRLIDSFPFGDHGLLQGIKVRIDGPGGNDTRFQLFEATLSTQIWIEE